MSTPSEHVIEIHTSDRQTFKRCRRKWEWGSTLGENLVRLGQDQKAFWIGTGVHFALEDWWGYRRFAHPALAFGAYVDAQDPDALPDQLSEAEDLAIGMLSYYVEDWLEEHPEPYETLWVTDPQTGLEVPQVEVEIRVDITQLLFDNLPLGHEARAYGASPDSLEGYQDFLEENFGGRNVAYVCTLDRAVIDKHNRIYGVDYKTAASFDEFNLIANPQAGAYDWAGKGFYGNLEGFIWDGMVWQQHRKLVPAEPKWVNEGKRNAGFSTALDQSTTYRLYAKALKRHYGFIPNEERYLTMLGILAGAQGPEGDRFVRREVLRRNEAQRRAEEEKIIAETLDMLDPNISIYPNPTKECSWDCPFRIPCLAKDDGADYEYILREEYTQWSGYRDDWRARVKYPASDLVEATI